MHYDQNYRKIHKHLTTSTTKNQLQINTHKLIKKYIKKTLNQIQDKS